MNKRHTPIFDRQGTTIGSDDLLTVPNLFTFLRLLAIPVFLWLLFVQQQRFASALLLGALGATDWVDGYLARKLQQQSRFGRVFDPSVDRLMFVVAVWAMIIVEAAPLWLLVAILVREVLVGFAAGILLLKGMETLKVSWWGKTAAFGLMFALPLLLGASANPDGKIIYLVLGWFMAIPSLMFSYWSGFGYVPLLAQLRSSSR